MYQLNNNIRGYAIRVNENSVPTGSKYDPNYIIGYLTGYYDDSEDFIYEYVPSIPEAKKFGVDTYYISKSGVDILNTRVNIDKHISELKSSLNSGVAKSQNLLNEVITYHKSILEKNLLCARGLEIMTDSGAAVPVEFKQRLFNIQAKLINRNNALKTSGYVTNIQEGEHPKLSAYNQALVSFMNNPGIGFVISGTAIIIILAVVSAASAAIAYAVFKKMHTEAKADFSFSNDLTAELIKYLPAPVYEQLMKENAANQAAAQDAIDKAKGGGIFTAVKTGGLILLGVWVADKFVFNNSSSSKN